MGRLLRNPFEEPGEPKTETTLLGAPQFDICIYINLCACITPPNPTGLVISTHQEEGAGVDADFRAHIEIHRPAWMSLPFRTLMATSAARIFVGC